MTFDVWRLTNNVTSIFTDETMYANVFILSVPILLSFFSVLKNIMLLFLFVNLIAIS